MQKKTKICITDDHKIVCQGIKSFLIGNKEFELVNCLSNGKELLNTLKDNQPDILLLDINLPGLSGIQIAKIIKKEYPKIKIIFLSSNTDSESLNNATKAGGFGYLSKDIKEEEFLFALTEITAGKKYFSKGVQNQVFENYSTAIKTKIQNDILTEREIEVVKLFVEGYSYKEIAERLFISKRTVETHKKNILDKLNLKSTVDLVKYAILNGIISL